tara:strand:- start:18 stop:308 length:291 start_codon:yes stop_codon:yes gene_type:complete
MKPNMIDAVRALVPNAQLVFSETEIMQWHSKEPQPSQKDINDKLKELQAEYDSKQYQRDRAVAYDPIPEQLDQIYHDIDGWKAKIKSVKDKYPKPT